MKRKDAVLKLAEFLIELPEGTVSVEADADAILEFVEKKLVMRPPRLPDDECQAILQIYFAGYNLHQWEEDFAKDEKVMERLAGVRERNALTPQERIERRRKAVEKFNLERKK